MLLNLLRTRASFFFAVLDADEEEFCRNWLEESDRGMAHFCAWVNLGFHIVSLALDPIMMRMSFYEVMWKLHIFAIAVSILFLVLRKNDIHVRPLILLLLGLTVLGYLYLFHRGVALHDEPIVAIKTWSGYLTVGIFAVLMCPYHFMVPAAGAILILLGSIPPWLHIAEGYKMTFVTAFAMTMTAFVQWAQTQRLKHNALTEFHAMKKLHEAELRQIDNELSLARDIQNSLKTPTYLKTEQVVAYCYQSRTAHVGGDWVAFRRGLMGELIVVVADATGKGMQAALVVHAVQSLWAETLDDPRFEPIEWLRRVNKTLYRLGETKPHSMTMGILVVKTDLTLTYWSAGHLPLFIIRGDEINGHVKVVGARGDILGLSPELKIKSEVAQLDRATTLSILLGSDGVFPKGTGHSKQDLLRFARDVAIDGGHALEVCASDDDKTLVWLHRRAG